MQGKNVSCAVTPEDWLIVNTMSSARVMHVGGQCVYFCCQACATTFWRQPAKSIIGASPTASSVAGGSGNNNVNREPSVGGAGEGYGATFVMASILVTSVLSIVAFVVLTKMWKNSVPVPALGGKSIGAAGVGSSSRIRRKHKQGFDRLEAQPGTDDSDDDFGGTYCDDDDDIDTI
jgi:YHS domain-containing protein